MPLKSPLGNSVVSLLRITFSYLFLNDNANDEKDLLRDISKNLDATQRVTWKNLNRSQVKNIAFKTLPVKFPVKFPSIITGRQQGSYVL